MNVQRLVDHWRLQVRIALGEEGGGQHVEIARVDHVRRGEQIALGSGEACAAEDRLDPLDVGAIKGAPQVDILPFRADVVAATHREADHVEPVVAKALDATPYGGIGGVVCEKCDTRHARICLQAVGPPQTRQHPFDRSRSVRAARQLH
jgi:hypothetical protein